MWYPQGSILGVNVRHHFDSYVTAEVVWDGMGVWLVVIASVLDKLMAAYYQAVGAICQPWIRTRTLV